MAGAGEICLTPERWSWRERPVAAQGDPEAGPVHTHYKDKRTVRVHTLSWSNASAVERALAMSILPSESGGSVSARFTWTTPLREAVDVTLLNLPDVVRQAQAGGAITMELEEELRDATEQPSGAGAFFLINLHYVPGAH